MLTILPTRAEATLDLPLRIEGRLDFEAFQAVIAQLGADLPASEEPLLSVEAVAPEPVSNDAISAEQSAGDGVVHAPDAHIHAQDELHSAQSVPFNLLLPDVPQADSDHVAVEEATQEADRHHEAAASVEAIEFVHVMPDSGGRVIPATVEARPAARQADRAVKMSNGTTGPGRASDVSDARPVEVRPAARHPDRVHVPPPHEPARREEANPDRRTASIASSRPLSGGSPTGAMVADGRPDQATPAMMRAEQVEAGVRLENATGQPAAPASVGSAFTIPTGATTAALGESGGSNAQSTPAPEPPEAAGRILRGLATMLNTRGGTMTMRLEPPELGQLRVQMTLARGVVSAHFFPANHQAQLLLEQNIVALRLGLEQRGLLVERLIVQPTPPPSVVAPSAMNESSPERSSNEQRHDAGGGESRGRDEHRPHGGRSEDRRFIEAMDEVSATKAPVGVEHS
jgi:hypothetical protein